MRQIILGWILCLPATALAQYYGPADYSIERWDEDYSYLHSAPPRDLFDPIKFMPLNQSGDQYISLGGQARWRYDYFNNLGFGKPVQDEDGFNLFRLLAHADAHFGPARIFVQLNSGMVFDRTGGPRQGDADDFDFQQAFADLKVPIDQADSVLLRVGRQELVYGAQRLISPNDWGNVRRSFEGAKFSYSSPNDVVDVFWVRPVEINKSHLNSGDDSTSFAGIYNVAALPQLLAGADSKLDLYFLALDESASSTHAVGADIFTLGTRLHTTPGPWDFDIEPDFQFGRSGSTTVTAYALAAEGGYTFRKAALSPRASLGFDLASGSANGAHRFNQLFPPQYLHLGHMYVLGRQNVIDLHPGLALELTDSLHLTIDEHIFWRQNTQDAAYDLVGNVVRAPDGSHAASIGNELDIALYWQIQRHLSAYMGYAHFFAGQFIHETGPHSDIDFFYTSLTFTF